MCATGDKAFRRWCGSEEVQKAICFIRQEEVNKALAFSEIPSHWKEKTPVSLEGQENLILTVNRYLDGFPKFREQGIGMYLWSEGSGRGKTHVLSTVCNELIQRYLVPCIFMTEEQMYFRIREAYQNPAVSEKKQYRKFMEAKCLFLDDLGATKITPWKNEVLTGILDYRLNHRLPTFFTSNFSPEGYEQNLQSSSIARPGRITSRIYEMCRGFILEVKGEDFRKKLAFKLQNQI
ncbi:MAG: ATP-binding protein [Candidatus Brocadiae bacterium]|nr:ATP-binding protein [Candidatus Brocadiia bacterium]